MVSESSGINLNAPASSANWDAFETPSLGFPGKVQADGLYLVNGLLVANGVMAVNVPTGADYSTCKRASGWEELDGGIAGSMMPNAVGVPLNSLEEKPVTCLRLASGRYATVGRIEFNQKRTAARLSLKVWDRTPGTP